MQPELNSELEKIHLNIAQMLGLDRSLLTFNYNNTDEGRTTLELTTLNPRHHQTFLFHTISGFGEHLSCQLHGVLGHTHLLNLSHNKEF